MLPALCSDGDRTQGFGNAGRHCIDRVHPQPYVRYLMNTNYTKTSNLSSPILQISKLKFKDYWSEIPSKDLSKVPCLVSNKVGAGSEACALGLAVCHPRLGVWIWKGLTSSGNRNLKVMECPQETKAQSNSI